MGNINDTVIGKRAKLNDQMNKTLQMLDEGGASDDAIKQAKEAFDNRLKAVNQKANDAHIMQKDDFGKLNKGNAIAVGGSPKGSMTQKMDPNLVASLRGDFAKPGKSGLNAFVDSAKQFGKRTSKKLPGLAAILGLGELLQSQGASAGELASDVVPGGVEGVGPKPGDEGYNIENPSGNAEQDKLMRLKALQRLNNQ